MVSILEPFIDTIVVCSVTALVILSSGAWTQKYENSFDRTSMLIFDGSYSEENANDVEELGKFILDRRNFTNNTSSVKNFSGSLEVLEGKIQQDNITIFHKQSIAEDVLFMKDGKLINGLIDISNG